MAIKRLVMGVTFFFYLFTIIMAFFRYLSEAQGDCLFSSFTQILDNAGLHISFSSSEQIFAECNDVDVYYKSKVKVLISWSDQSKRECCVEIRSDESHLRRDTRCKKVHSHLQKVIPPKETPAFLRTAEV
tara:strand:+ start:641 stop:1030 length:390 start_codon:yes stop_codon:yes gene_type:complete